MAATKASRSSQMVMYERNTAELKSLNDSEADTLALSPAVQARNAERMCELVRLIENFRSKSATEIPAKPPNSRCTFTRNEVKRLVYARNYQDHHYDQKLKSLNGF